MVERVGRYKDLRMIDGKPVYFGKDSEDNPVILKRQRSLPIPEDGNPLDSQIAARLLETHRRLLFYEASVLMGLDHPNICKYKDIFKNGDDVYLVVSHEGPTDFYDFVDQVNNPRRPLPQGNHSIILEDIARALMHCHSKGIVHHDVKTDNVAIDGGRGKLIDFGAARRIGETDPLILSQVAYTPSCVAPEYFDEGYRSNPALDVFSFSVMVFESLKVHAPFAVNEEWQLQYHRPIYDEKELRATPLGRMVLAGLHVYPERRPPLEEIADSLKEINSRWNRPRSEASSALSLSASQ